MKTQLRQQIAEIEKQEKSMEAAMRPTSVAEAQDLEKKLGAALDEVRRQKTELENKGKGKA